MTELGFPEAGDRIECVLPAMDMKATKAKTRFVGTVARTEPAEDGWGAGVLVDYEKLKWKGVTGVAIFHEWPNRWLKIVP